MNHLSKFIDMISTNNVSSVTECKLSDKKGGGDEIGMVYLYLLILLIKEPRGCDHMVVGFTITYAISAYHH